MSSLYQGIKAPPYHTGPVQHTVTDSLSVIDLLGVLKSSCTGHSQAAMHAGKYFPKSSLTEMHAGHCTLRETCAK